MLIYICTSVHPKYKYATKIDDSPIKHALSSLINNIIPFYLLDCLHCVKKTHNKYLDVFIVFAYDHINKSIVFLTHDNGWQTVFNR